MTAIGIDTHKATLAACAHSIQIGMPLRRLTRGGRPLDPR